MGTLASVESEVPPEVAREQMIQQYGRDQQSSNAYQKLIEQKERELRESIMANYSRIKEVEKELSDLTVQLQVNVGPRKHALEMLRAKIEKQNEKVAKVRSKYITAKQTMLKLEEELTREEAAKDLLCSELGMLVQQSASAQLAKLEELKNHLDSLNRGVNRGMSPTATSEPQTANLAPASSPTPFANPFAHPVPSTDDSQNPFLSPQESTASTSQAQAADAAQQARKPPSAPGVDGTKAASGSAPGKANTGAKSRQGSKTGAVDGQGGPVGDEADKQKLLADVAAARARLAGGGSAAASAAGIVSATASPRTSGSGGHVQMPGSPRRAPPGASLLAAVTTMERAEAGAAQGGQGGAGQNGTGGRGNSRFAGFDV